MNRLVRYEFMGNSLLFAILFLLGVTIPFAILFLLNTTVRIEHALDDPEAFVKAYRAGTIPRK